jgi:hypothetical protein
MCAALIGNEGVTYLVVGVVCMAAFVAVGQTLYSRHEQRLGRELPSRSAQGRLVAQRKA